MEKKQNNYEAVPVKIDELKERHPEIADMIEQVENSTEFSCGGLGFIDDDMLLYSVRDYVLMRMEKRERAFMAQWQKEFGTLPKLGMNAPDEGALRRAVAGFRGFRDSYSFWLEGGQSGELCAMFTDGEAVVSAGLLETHPECTVMTFFEECSSEQILYYECVNNALATDSVYF